jgi:hypothetical protein
MDTDRKIEIETKLVDLKARWPKHSVPPWMWQELEEMEDELKKITKETAPKPDAK